MVIFEVGLRGFLIVKAPFILKYLLLFFSCQSALDSDLPNLKCPHHPS